MTILDHAQALVNQLRHRAGRLDAVQNRYQAWTMMGMGRMMRDPAAIALRSNYSNSVRGPVFAANLTALRDDVCAATQGTLEDPAVAELVFRAGQLRRRIQSDVGGAYRAEAHLALDIICIYLCGVTAEVADRLEREHNLSMARGVPAEVGSMLGGPVVSGGLPTLGRRRR